MKNAKLITLFTLVLLTKSSVVKAADAGSIVSWGAIAFDSRELDSNDFIAISAGGNHTLALKSDGSIIGWGINYSGRAMPPDGNDFVAIAAGGSHGLALKSDGSIIGWGMNYNEQATPLASNNFV